MEQEEALDWGAEDAPAASSSDRGKLRSDDLSGVEKRIRSPPRTEAEDDAISLGDDDDDTHALMRYRGENADGTDDGDGDVQRRPANEHSPAKDRTEHPVNSATRARSKSGDEKQLTTSSGLRPRADSRNSRLPVPPAAVGLPPKPASFASPPRYRVSKDDIMSASTMHTYDRDKERDRDRDRERPRERPASSTSTSRSVPHWDSDSNDKVSTDESPLPPNWEYRISSATKMRYFYNSVTHESTWTHPSQLEAKVSSSDVGDGFVPETVKQVGSKDVERRSLPSDRQEAQEHATSPFSEQRREADPIPSGDSNRPPRPTPPERSSKISDELLTSASLPPGNSSPNTEKFKYTDDRPSYPVKSAAILRARDAAGSESSKRGLRRDPSPHAHDIRTSLTSRERAPKVDSQSFSRQGYGPVTDRDRLRDHDDPTRYRGREMDYDSDKLRPQRDSEIRTASSFTQSDARDRSRNENGRLSRQYQTQSSVENREANSRNINPHSPTLRRRSLSPASHSRHPVMRQPPSSPRDPRDPNFPSMHIDNRYDNRYDHSHPDRDRAFSSRQTPRPADHEPPHEKTREDYDPKRRRIEDDSDSTYARRPPAFHDPSPNNMAERDMAGPQAYRRRVPLLSQTPPFRRGSDYGPDSSHFRTEEKRRDDPRVVQESVARFSEPYPLVRPDPVETIIPSMPRKRAPLPPQEDSFRGGYSRRPLQTSSQPLHPPSPQEARVALPVPSGPRVQAPQQVDSAYRERSTYASQRKQPRVTDNMDVGGFNSDRRNSDGNRENTLHGSLRDTGPTRVNENLPRGPRAMHDDHDYHREGRPTPPHTQPEMPPFRQSLPRERNPPNDSQTNHQHPGLHPEMKFLEREQRRSRSPPQDASQDRRRNAPRWDPPSDGPEQGSSRHHVASVIPQHNPPSVDVPQQKIYMGPQPPPPPPTGLMPPAVPPFDILLYSKEPRWDSSSARSTPKVSGSNGVPLAEVRAWGPTKRVDSIQPSRPPAESNYREPPYGRNRVTLENFPRQNFRSEVKLAPQGSHGSGNVPQDVRTNDLNFPTHVAGKDDGLRGQMKPSQSSVSPMEYGKQQLSYPPSQSKIIPGEHISGYDRYYPNIASPRPPEKEFASKILRADETHDRGREPFIRQPPKEPVHLPDPAGILPPAINSNGQSGPGKSVRIQRPQPTKYGREENGRNFYHDTNPGSLLRRLSHPSGHQLAINEQSLPIPSLRDRVEGAWSSGASERAMDVDIADNHGGTNKDVGYTDSDIDGGARRGNKRRTIKGRRGRK